MKESDLVLSLDWSHMSFIQEKHLRRVVLFDLNFTLWWLFSFEIKKLDVISRMHWDSISLLIDIVERFIYTTIIAIISSSVLNKLDTTFFNRWACLRVWVRDSHLKVLISDSNSRCNRVEIRCYVHSFGDFNIKFSTCVKFSLLHFKTVWISVECSIVFNVWRVKVHSNVFTVLLHWVQHNLKC